MFWDKMKPGDVAKIAVINCSDLSVKRYLFSLGLRPGAKFTFLGRAPWGGPIKLKVDNTSICLRMKEAKDWLTLDNYENYSKHLV